MAKSYDCSGWATKANMLCADGRVIMKNAFKECDGEIVPLVWNHQHNSVDEVLGHALLENRDEGVYAYATFNDTDAGQTAKLLVQHGDVNRFSIYANRLKQQGSNVVHGVIRELSLVLAGANPGAVIESVIMHGEDALEEGYICPDEYIENKEALSHSDNEEGATKVTEENNKNNGDEETLKDIFETLNEKQKKAVYALIGLALEEEPSGDDKEDDVKHSDDEETVEDVLNTLNEKQKTVVHALIGMALEEAGVDIDEENEGGNTDMKHNVFDNDTDKMEVLTHSDMVEIMDDAKRNGSLKEAFLQHGIEQIDYLFPDAKKLNNAPDFIKRDDTWVSDVMNAVHKTPFSRIKSVHADITEADARARGYVKGNLKFEEVISLLKRVTNPTTIYKKQKLDTASPGLGGVVQRIDSRANAVFIRRIIAKIPTGYSIKQTENSMGTGYKIEWLTSRAGTGRFTEYIYRYTCGASGSFSNGGHMYIEGAAATSDKPVTWYIASCETYDMLGKNITNFMNFDDSGLIIGDNTKGTLGKNVLIDSDSVDIRNGNTVLASFSGSRIDLGKNNVNAIIGLCDNKGTIEVVDYTEYQALELRSKFTEIVGEQQVRICSLSSAGACIYVEDYNILLLNRPVFDDGTGKTFESSIGLTDNGIYISMKDDKSVSQLSIKSTIIEANKQIKAPDLYGTNKVLANSGFQTGGCVDTFKNNILWSGSAMWPNASQTANFSQTVSKQPHGIVLVFRGYNSGVKNGDWHSFFVSKHEVAKHGGQGHCFFLSHTPSTMFATKYIYISDNRLTGHDNNSKSETTSEGITYRNNRYALQYVLGV